MKSTGIVRQVDELGRIVIPMELRRTMEIEEGTPLEIYTESEDIILRKYAPGCHCCGEEGKVMKQIFGRNVCPKCYEKFKKQMNLIDNLRGGGVDSRR